VAVERVTMAPRQKPGAGQVQLVFSRYLAVAGAVAAAVLYVLIGFQVVSIGQSSSGGTPDLLPFGLMAGGAFAVIALLLLFVRRRIVWVLVAAFDLFVILAYFAMSNLRVPPFEVWGLLVKASEAVTFAALVHMIVRAPAVVHPTSTPTFPGR
jgi:hypothetical protein